MKRYPEFHHDAFLSMRDEEARRYEWRVLEAIDPEAARKSTRRWDYDQFPYYQQPAWFDRSVMTRAERSVWTDATQEMKPPHFPPAGHPMYANERRSRASGGRRPSDVH